ncbi:glycosyltransferase family 61 protein [Psychromonas sp. GE-S-Ul-11]|uniref:glycosyltransferase family 61 protein n=1 Tax=Psychromonas sp. GE-S-Ul-11 TaxID=3241170 RepID=UPI00390CAFD6
MRTYYNVKVLQKNLIEEEGKVTVPDFYREREGVIDYINYPDEAVLNVVNSNNNSIETIKGKSFFGGYLYAHYGHFILESLSRLSNYNGEENIIWVGNTKYRKKFQDLIFKHLGLENVNHIFVQETIECEELTVTDRNYIIWSKFTKNHYSYLSRNSEENSKYSNKKVWLSRSGFNSYANENIIEILLSFRGWEIIQLEELSFQEQISVFNSAKQIAGVEGTAFHNMVFSKNVIDEIHIFKRKGKEINGNYFLISDVVNKNHKFHSPEKKPSGEVNICEVFECLGDKLNDNDINVINYISRVKKDSKKGLVNKVKQIELQTKDRYKNLSKDLRGIIKKYE